MPFLSSSLQLPARDPLLDGVRDGGFPDGRGRDGGLAAEGSRDGRLPAEGGRDGGLPCDDGLPGDMSPNPCVPDEDLTGPEGRPVFLPPNPPKLLKLGGGIPGQGPPPVRRPPPPTTPF